MNIKYNAIPLHDLRPSEYEAEVGEVVEGEIEIDMEGILTVVTVVAPKGYELTERDYINIQELIEQN